MFEKPPIGQKSPSWVTTWVWPQKKEIKKKKWYVFMTYAKMGMGWWWWWYQIITNHAYDAMYVCMYGFIGQSVRRWWQLMMVSKSPSQRKNISKKSHLQPQYRACITRHTLIEHNHCQFVCRTQLKSQNVIE